MSSGELIQNLNIGKHRLNVIQGAATEAEAAAFQRSVALQLALDHANTAVQILKDHVKEDITLELGIFTISNSAATVTDSFAEAELAGSKNTDAQDARSRSLDINQKMENIEEEHGQNKAHGQAAMEAALQLQQTARDFAIGASLVRGGLREVAKTAQAGVQSVDKYLRQI